MKKNKNSVVVKKFGKDFDSSGGALTLSSSEVTDGNVVSGKRYSKKHESGWTISGVVHEDYYEWVNEFFANHPKFGQIQGDFESEVHAESEEAFQHFWENHTPNAWDYGDI